MGSAAQSVCGDSACVSGPMPSAEHPLTLACSSRECGSSPHPSPDPSSLSQPSHFSKPSPEMRRPFVPFVKVFRSSFSSAMAPGECFAFISSSLASLLLGDADLPSPLRAKANLRHNSSRSPSYRYLRPVGRRQGHSLQAPVPSTPPTHYPFAVAIPDTHDRDTLTPSPSLSPTRPAAPGLASNMASTTTS